MYPISQLQQSIENPQFFANMFSMKGNINILFVEPQLSSKHLYKSLFPFFNLFEGKRDNNGKLEEIYVSSAITGIDKYDPETQLVSIHTRVTEEQIKWADVIVFPFTTEDLSDEYKRIREQKKCHIVFGVDFNYYELDSSHPYKKYFKKFDTVESNILLADYCFTANPELQNYLLENLKEVVEEKKIVSEVKFYNIPYFIDTKICNYNVEEPAMFEIVRQAAKHPDKVAPVVAKKKGRPKKVVASSAPAAEEKKIVTPGTQVFYEPINVGIIYSKTYNADYKFYNDSLRRLPENVNLIVIGYDPKEDSDEVFSGVTFEYVKPCSVKVFYKQLHGLKLDFCLIPLMNSVFNVTSECLGRYLECGMFGIPILAPNIFPYQAPIIRDQDNGFLFKDKNDMVDKIKHLSSVMPFVRSVVNAGARRDVTTRYVWNEENKKHWLRGLN